MIPRLSRWLPVCVLLVAPLSARTIEVSPRPEDGVLLLDGAALLTTDERQEVRELMEETRDLHGIELVLLTTSHLDDEPKGVAVDTLNEWEAGQHSVILLVSMEPRKLYIQPGTALASVFDEEWSSAICRDFIAPQMRAGDYAAAIRSGLEAIRDRAIDPTSVPKRSGFRWWILAIVVPVLSGAGIGLFFVFRDRRRPCPQCQAKMDDSTRLIRPATYTREGRSERTFHCTACAHSFSEMVTLPLLVESVSSSSSWSSDSWSSSSSDSSSSSSSSDSSGGGGSDW